MDRELETEVDKNACLRRPNLHDGKVSGISVDEKIAKFSVIDSSGSRFSIYLSDVSHLRCDDFREGNIISVIWVMTNNKNLKSEIDRGVRWIIGELHPSVAEPYRQRHEDTIATLISEVMSGKRTLF